MKAWEQIIADELPADQGELQQRGLARILGQLWFEKFSGLVKVVQEPFTRYLILREGYLDTARSTDPDDRLGEALVQYNMISAYDFYRACRETLQSRKQLGQILVEQGALAPEDLLEALRKQVLLILTRIFNWPAGQFYVYLYDDEIPHTSGLHLNTPLLLFDAAGSVDRWSVIFNDIRRMERIPRFQPNDAWALIATKLSPEENHVISLCNGRFSLATVCEMSYLSSLHTLRLIWIAYSLQLVELTDTKSMTGAYPEFQVAETSADEHPAEYQEFMLQDLVQKYNEMYQSIIEPLRDEIHDGLNAFLEQCIEPIRGAMPERMKNVTLNDYGEIDMDTLLLNFGDLGYSRKLRELTSLLEDILYALIYNLEQVVPPELANQLKERALASHRRLK